MRRKPPRPRVFVPTPAELAMLDELDVLIEMSGAVRCVDAESLQALPPRVLQMWAVQNGIYAFPTTQLVTFLGLLIGGEVVNGARLGGNRTIEIGAGNGGLAKALGIPATDSMIQADPTMRSVYGAFRQAPVGYGSHVMPLEALAAVEMFQPHTVVASYVTQKWLPGDTEGFTYGVDEVALLRRVRSYILIGSDSVHSHKRIMALPHRTIRAPWLVTRTEHPRDNAIWIWEGSGADATD